MMKEWGEEREKDIFFCVNVYSVIELNVEKGGLWCLMPFSTIFQLYRGNGGDIWKCV